MYIRIFATCVYLHDTILFATCVCLHEYGPSFANTCTPHVACLVGFMLFVRSLIVFGRAKKAENSED